MRGRRGPLILLLALTACGVREISSECAWCATDSEFAFRFLSVVSFVDPGSTPVRGGVLLQLILTLGRHRESPDSSNPPAAFDLMAFSRSARLDVGVGLIAGFSGEGRHSSMQVPSTLPL